MTNEELVEAIRDGERDRLPELWEQVQRLARFWANKYTRSLAASGRDSNSREAFEEFFQCGYIAMVAAVDTFDSAGGGLFAHWYGLYYKQEVWSLMHWRSEKDPRTGKHVTISPDAMAHSTSLDTPVGNDSDGGTLQDIIPDTVDQYEAAEHRIWLEQLHNALEDELDALPEGQGEVIRRRFYDGQTYDAIAQDMSMPYNAVRPIESHGLRELRKPKVTKRLRPFIRVEDIRAAGMHGTGLYVYKQTGMSSTERVALEILDGKPV